MTSPPGPRYVRGQVPTTNVRKLAGVLAATSVTPVAVLLLFTILTPVFLLTDRHLSLSGLPIVVLFATLGSFLMTLLVGLPLAGWLRRRGNCRALDFAVWGALSAIVPFLLFDLYIAVYELGSVLRNGPDVLAGRLVYLFKSLPTALAWLALAAWCGTWSALAYWRVAVFAEPGPK